MTHFSFTYNSQSFSTATSFSLEASSDTSSRLKEEWKKGKKRGKKREYKKLVFSNQSRPLILKKTNYL